MDGYLSLQVREPDGRTWRRPSSLLDLGHVEILLWSNGQAARSYGFYVSPPTRWRVFLSVLWGQRARVARSGPLPDKPGRRCCWRLSAECYASALAFLEHATQRCETGSLRYRALRYNCFHFAFDCLEEAGLRWPRRGRQRALIFRTIGSASFCRDMLDAPRQGEPYPERPAAAAP